MTDNKKIIPENDNQSKIATEIKPRSKYAITEESIRDAYQTYLDYDTGFRAFVERCKENEKIYHQQFEFTKKGKDGKSSDFATHSAWLLSSINNKHADAMDNIPSPQVLPREESDKATATMLQRAIPVILDHANYEQTYSNAWYSKIKFGLSIQGVFWDGGSGDGMGDINISAPNILNCRWDPQVSDIQLSKNFFFAEYVDNDTLIAQFPFCRDKLAAVGDSIDEFDKPAEYKSKSDRSLVINWYYKRNNGNRTNVHYCKFTGDCILYASENLDEYLEKGYYWHGKYPFVVDRMYPEESTAFAFGTIDMGRECQSYIDRLQGAILKNALLSSKLRKLVREDGQINIDDYANYDKDIITYRGNLDPNTIVDLQSPTLPQIYVSVLNDKINELKETTNCRDFSQGSTTSGVTAASAIAALQEAGSKTSRDIIKSSYRAYKDMCYMIIELIRQFYDIPRVMRIVLPNGQEQFTQVSNAEMLSADPLSGRLPVYDLVITAQKSSPYSTMAQNELAKELYGAGLFNPQLADQAKIALDMMEFEGKENVLSKVAENSQLVQAVSQLQQTCAQLAAIVDSQNGTTILANMQASGLPGAAQATAPQVQSSGSKVNTLGENVQTKDGSQADKLKAKAMDMAQPR